MRRRRLAWQLARKNSRGQRNFSIAFIFVSCEEKGYYRVGLLSFDWRSYTVGAAAVWKAFLWDPLVKKGGNLSSNTRLSAAKQP